MSILFQLFRADDLKELDEAQIVEMKEMVRAKMQVLQDTSVESFIEVSRYIKHAHMTQLLPEAAELSDRLHSESALRNLTQKQLKELTERGDRKQYMPISEESAAKIPPELLPRLRQRASDVFQQLMSRPAEDLTAEQSVEDHCDLLDRLLSPADLRALKEKGTKAQIIFAWALTCELANLKVYETLRDIKECTWEKFMEFTERNTGTKKRPQGPDSLYSPFYDLHPLKMP